jgi:hypothetical protein
LLGCNLTEHHGVIDFGDNEIEVAISFDGSLLRLTSSGDEIGVWDRSSYSLTRSGKSTFVLHAENYDLTFRPISPEEFAQAASRGLNDAAPKPSHRKQSGRHRDRVEPGPQAKPITLILFYLLVIGTLAMGAWAFMSILN